MQGSSWGSQILQVGLDGEEGWGLRAGKNRRRVAGLGAWVGPKYAGVIMEDLNTGIAGGCKGGGVGGARGRGRAGGRGGRGADTGWRARGGGYHDPMNVARGRGVLYVV